MHAIRRMTIFTALCIGTVITTVFGNLFLGFGDRRLRLGHRDFCFLDLRIEIVHFALKPQQRYLRDQSLPDHRRGHVHFPLREPQRFFRRTQAALHAFEFFLPLLVLLAEFAHRRGQFRLPRLVEFAFVVGEIGALSGDFGRKVRRPAFRLGLEPQCPGEQTIIGFLRLAEFRRRRGIVNPEQDLVLLHLRVLAGEQAGDDAAFQILHHLNFR